MKKRKGQNNPQKKSDGQWAQYSKLIRYIPSGTYYARFRVRGKLIWKSLRTHKITVAQMRLADPEMEERKNAGRGQRLNKGKVLFKAALQAYREKGFRPEVPRSPGVITATWAAAAAHRHPPGVPLAPARAAP